jgi:hypothetical protein
MQHRETQMPQIHRHEVEQQNGENQPRHQKRQVHAHTVEQKSQQNGDWEDVASIFLHYSGLQVSFGDLFRAAKVVFFIEILSFACAYL